LPIVPFWLVPLIAEGKARFWHETAYFVIPPKLSVLVRWGPKDPDRVFHVFALTFGKPKNFYTGEVVYTDKVYFWHRGREMVWHYDPLVESIVDYEYPHEVRATAKEPLEIEFHNDTDNLTVAIDVSAWLFEYHKDDAKVFDEYVRGVANLFRALGRLSVEEIEGVLKSLARTASTR